MDIAVWKAMTWSQFGAATRMLGNTILACPRGVWEDRSRLRQAANGAPGWVFKA